MCHNGETKGNSRPQRAMLNTSCCGSKNSGIVQPSESQLATGVPRADVSTVDMLPCSSDGIAFRYVDRKNHECPLASFS